MISCIDRIFSDNQFTNVIRPSFLPKYHGDGTLTFFLECIGVLEGIPEAQKQQGQHCDLVEMPLHFYDYRNMYILDQIQSNSKVKSNKV